MGGVTEQVSTVGVTSSQVRRAPDGVPDEPQEWPLDFEAFVQRHSARLIRSLAMITLDRGLAEDAAQDAFLQLYVHWHEVPGMRDPAAWLYRVGMNRCKNYRRTVRRTARLVDRVGRSLADDPPGEWPEETDFMALFESLPKRQRSAVALRYLAGFSTAEIAQAMGISEGAVGSHLHKARASLRKVLEVE
jgi:RNA polymerase sigma factor (sigma-70 family)